KPATNRPGIRYFFILVLLKGTSARFPRRGMSSSVASLAARLWRTPVEAFRGAASRASGSYLLHFFAVASHFMWAFSQSAWFFGAPAKADEVATVARPSATMSETKVFIAIFSLLGWLSLGISSSKDGDPTLAICLGFGRVPRNSVAGESVARQFSLSTALTKQHAYQKPLIRLQSSPGSRLARAASRHRRDMPTRG